MDKFVIRESEQVDSMFRDDMEEEGHSFDTLKFRELAAKAIMRMSESELRKLGFTLEKSGVGRDILYQVTITL